jgi:acetylglutamate kinase
VEKAIEKAATLIEALTWIRQFRGKVTVIKLGGSVMEHPDIMAHLLLDVVFMETVGMRPVIVHGGGAAISRGMADAGVEPRFVQGRRYTDDLTLDIVERVLAGTINPELADKVGELGGVAEPLNFFTTNVLTGERITLDGENGEQIDLGHVGRVTDVDVETIGRLCDHGVVPIIPSLAMTVDGEKLNINADTAAQAVAEALSAEKLVYLSDVNGVRRDKDDPESLMHSLSAGEAEGLIGDGTIASGMIPKVQACLETLDKGVKKVHIIDGRLRHSLLLEVYTSSGVGTVISKGEK